MGDRRYLVGVLLALSLLVFGNHSQIAFAGRPDPLMADKQPQTNLGYDISFPQCPRPFPTGTFAFGIVGVTEGVAFTTNDCLHEQFVWAQQATTSAPGLYLNLNSPMYATMSQAMNGPRGRCSWADGACQSYNYGYNSAQAAFDYASSKGATTQMWWLDVEWQNYWNYDYALNDLVIQGAIDFVVSKGAAVGIYSTQRQWYYIAGWSFAPGLPNNTSLPIWLATVEKANAAAEWCTPNNAFGGGTVWYVQYPGKTFDQNISCLN